MIGRIRPRKTLVQTQIHHSTKTSKPVTRGAAAKGRRPSAWRPQPTGLTRDELRAIVMEQLG